MRRLFESKFNDKSMILHTTTNSYNSNIYTVLYMRSIKYYILHPQNHTCAQSGLKSACAARSAREERCVNAQSN